jgi:predicted fused transcriptional regulator/phosphomethylpyrimidine kinase
VEDILKRLGNVETNVSEVRSQVSAILAIIPHLATKADVADVRGKVHAELTAAIGKVNAEKSAKPIS